MIPKNPLYTQAVQFRKRGFTYDEIARVVGVSKSTVSTWLAREPWSQSVRTTNQKRAAQDNSKRISLLNKARSNQNKKLYTEAERSAQTEFKHYKKDPLFIAGLMLYVGSGDQKHPHLMRITSSRHAAHRVFIRFATEYLGVSREKVRFWVLLPPHASPVKCERLWSKVTGIPAKQFGRFQVAQKQTTGQTLHDGVGNTIIGSTVLKRKLIVWMELLLKGL